MFLGVTVKNYLPFLDTIPSYNMLSELRILYLRTERTRGDEFKPGEPCDRKMA